ncbi:MAG TPA: hypothetical protein VH209_00770 [Steroidobacteraceae bacterium]|nr:hypothetical protein [Steroidobacteraceae bacterium]
MNAPKTGPLARDDPQVHLLDDTWFVTIFAVLLATALPWFVSAFDIDFAHAAWGIFALGVLHVALSTGAAPKGVSLVWRIRVLAILHAVGVMVLGFIWQHAGGTANPLFLLAFVLPVIGASFISRWQPYLTAALAVSVVFAISMSQEPELRWYVSGVGAAGAWLASLFDVKGYTSTAPIPGFYAPFGYVAVLLQVFAVLLFGCAVAADYVSAVLERLRTQAAAARAEAERGQELWATLTEHLPIPAFLVDADTLRVVCASEHASIGILPAGESPVGRAFFETMRFSYPDVVQNLIEGAGGVVPDVMIRVAGELRATELSVRHIPYMDRRFALVVVRDVTDATCVRIALDLAEHAALVVDARGHVKALNKPALSLFPGTHIGTSVSSLLSPSGWGATWWQSGLTGRRKALMEIRQRSYEVTSSSVLLPGEEESLHVVALRPTTKTQSRIGFTGPSNPPRATEVEPR